MSSVIIYKPSYSLSESVSLKIYKVKRILFKFFSDSAVNIIWGSWNQSRSIFTFTQLVRREIPNRRNSPPCPECERGVGSNRKRLVCVRCFSLTHLACVSYFQYKRNNITSLSPVEWTCNLSLLSELPFFKQRDISITENQNTYSQKSKLY